jgi:hypothetical protein
MHYSLPAYHTGSVPQVYKEAVYQLNASRKDNPIAVIPQISEPTMGINWSDVFYPGNPQRRHKAIVLTQKLYDTMKGNFRATNHLIDFLNDHIKNCNLHHINVDEEKTLEDNSNILTHAIKKIQHIVEEVDQRLKDKLDPDIYRKLTNVDLSFQERIETAKEVIHVVAEVVATTTAIVVCVAIASLGFLAPVVAVVGAVAASALGSVLLGALAGFSLAAIAGAIVGAIERDKLETAIKELEELNKKFIPVSHGYTDQIYEVLAELKIHELKK